MDAYQLSKKQVCYALYGLLLGDGSYSSGWVRIAHTNKQRSYVKFLAKFCRKNRLIFRTRYDFTKKTTFGDYDYSEIRIKLPLKTHFSKFDRLVDGNGRNKMISEYAMRRITPLGLLFWYLDDGNLHVSFSGKSGHRFAYLNTQSFSLKENKKIQKMFSNRFGIETSLNIDRSGFPKYKDKVYYRIYLSAASFRKFFDLVRCYLEIIPNDMQYKFNMKYSPNRLKNSQEFSEKYNLLSVS